MACAKVWPSAAHVLRIIPARATGQITSGVSARTSRKVGSFKPQKTANPYGVISIEGLEDWTVGG